MKKQVLVLLLAFAVPTHGLMAENQTLWQRTSQRAVSVKEWIKRHPVLTTAVALFAATGAAIAGIKGYEFVKAGPAGRLQAKIQEAETEEQVAAIIKDVDDELLIQALKMMPQDERAKEAIREAAEEKLSEGDFAEAYPEIIVRDSAKGAIEKALKMENAEQHLKKMFSDWDDDDLVMKAVAEMEDDERNDPILKKVLEESLSSDDYIELYLKEKLEERVVTLIERALTTTDGDQFKRTALEGVIQGFGTELVVKVVKTMPEKKRNNRILMEVLKDKLSTEEYADIYSE